MAKQQFPDLKAWLESIGLAKYAQVLEREEIALDVLGYLTEADLERLGIPLGPRKKLLREIALLGPAAPLAPREGISEEARRKFEDARNRAEEKARREADLLRREEEFNRREAEAEARRAADARARAEAEHLWEAEAKARAAAEERARLEAIERARKEAQAELAKREAELRKRETEARERAEAEAQARREAEEAAKKATAARARLEEEARIRRELEQKAWREAEARARAEAEASAKKEADERARREAEVARREAELQKKLAEMPQARMPVLPIIAALAVIAGLVGGWFWYRAGETARLAGLYAALDASVEATQQLNLALQRQKELQEQVAASRLAEEDARAKGDQTRLKQAQEATRRAEAEALKQAELVRQREADAKKADEVARSAEAKKRSDTARAAVEKAAQEKAAQEKAAAEKAAAEKLAAEKSASEKRAEEKAATERAPADKAAKARATPPAAVAASASALPGIGDRWTYEIRQSGKTYPLTVAIKSVSPDEVVDISTIPGVPPATVTHRRDGSVTEIASGPIDFAPYLQAFQQPKADARWSQIGYQNLPAVASQGPIDYNISARVAGKESVTVRGGTFDATRVTVSIAARAGVASIQAELNFWYANEIKRYIKGQGRTTKDWAFWGKHDFDLELVSYTPAGARRN